MNAAEREALQPLISAWLDYRGAKDDAAQQAAGAKILAIAKVLHTPPPTPHAAWQARVLAAAEAVADASRAVDGPAPTQRDFWAWHEAECALMTAVYQRPAKEDSE